MLTIDDVSPDWTEAEAKLLPAALEAKNWEAVRDAVFTVSKAPENAYRRFLLGYACFKSSDHLGTVAALMGLESEVPLMAHWVRYLRGQSMFALGRLQDAEADLAAIGTGSPLYRWAQYHLGDVYLALGKDSQAALAWERSGRTDAETISKRAAAMKSSGQSSDAMSLLKKAYYRTASAGRKAYKAALDALGFGAEAQQETAADLLEQAQALLDAHMNVDAEKAAGALVDSKSPDVRCKALLIRGLARQKLRKHKLALEDFDPLIQGCSQWVNRDRALFLAIRSSYRGGFNDKGEALAITLKTDHPDATFNDDVALMRARTALGGGKTKLAMEILDDSLKRWPEGDMADESRWLLAWSAYRGKEFKVALQALKDGAQFAQNIDYRSRFAYWEGRTLQKLKREKEAKKVYEQTVLAFPLKYHAWLALSRLADMRRGGKVNAVLDGLLKNQPRGQQFLTVADVTQLDQGAMGRALWLCKAGLPHLAENELGTSTGDSVDSMWLSTWILNLSGSYTKSHRAAMNLIHEGQPYWPNSDSLGYYKLSYPRPHYPVVQAAAKESEIEEALIYGVMRQESAFVTGIESRANAIGLMQLIMPTAKSMAKRLKLTATPQTLRTPEVNVRLGSQYLAVLLARFKLPILAIPGYNAGGGAIGKHLKNNPGLPLDEFVETIGAQETRNYARKVFESYAAYRFLYNEGNERFTRVDFNPKSPPH